MIPLLGEAAATRLRYGAPTVVDHQPVRPAPTSTPIRATAAPASAKTAKRAPNGIDVSALIEFVSYAEVRAAEEGSHTADRLVVNGLTYEVQTSTRQPPFLGQPEHWEGTALRVQALEVP